MATNGKQGGQRTNMTKPDGRKARSETNVGHKGSRVEPSHTKEQAKQDRAKKPAKGDTRKQSR